MRTVSYLKSSPKNVLLAFLILNRTSIKLSTCKANRTTEWLRSALFASQIQRIAQETFGYKRLRPGQQEVIQAVLDSHDTLAVMPTGSGKSAIYQIAALRLSGATVVISPLIALQRDQVEAIKDHEVASAAVVNSTVSVASRQQSFENLERKKLEFLFLAPEQSKMPKSRLLRKICRK